MNFLLQTIPSTLVSEVYTNSRFDGVVIDTEHGCFNNETLYSCIQFITTKKLCYVRFTDLNKQLVRMCLDAGASGAIFSTVNDYNYGKQIVEYCSYPPLGKRGCGIVRENRWGDFKLCENNPTLIAQIETQEAVDNLESIIKCGFDKYIIGPFDLSNSLNCVGDWDNKLYLSYISKIYNLIDISKLGLFLPTSDIINNFNKDKYSKPSLLIYGMDILFIKDGISSIISK